MIMNFLMKIITPNSINNQKLYVKELRKIKNLNLFYNNDFYHIINFCITV